jgi:hypothetical protein
MYQIPLYKYIIVLLLLLVGIVVFIYMLNFSVDNLVSNIKESLHFNQNKNTNIKYLTYNNHKDLKEKIKNYFTKFIMLLSEKKYGEMLELDWISKDLVKNLEKNNLIIYPIKEVINIEILYFIENSLKVKIINENLNFENKYFSNILDINFNIFNNQIFFKNIYIKQQPRNFIYASIYLKDNWKNTIENGEII